jgi:hypothetical protein
LHSQHLRWTYGALRGHRGDEWAKAMARLPVPEMVQRLAQAEATGVLLDRHGFNESDEAGKARLRIEQELQQLLGVEPLVSEGGRDVYFDLTAYTERLRASMNRAEWEGRRERAQHPIVPLWRNGFSMEDDFRYGGIGHWCSKTGELHLENTLTYPRTLRLRMQLLLEGRRESAPLRISGEIWQETIDIGQQPTIIERELTIPPGVHIIRMACDAPAITAAEDPFRRRLVFLVTRVTCEEK